MDPILGTAQTKKFTTGRLFWLPSGQADGFIDFGNVLDHKHAPKLQRLEHMASGRGGVRNADLSLVKTNSVLKTFTLDEEFAQIMLLLALGTQHANLVQPAMLGVDDTILTADNTEFTLDGTGTQVTAVINGPVSKRVYNLCLQGLTIVSAKDGNNTNMVAGVNYSLDAAAGMITVLDANPAAEWIIVFTWITVTDLVFTAFDNLFSNGTFRFVEYDQFDAVPYATETFTGQCYITSWGDNNEKITEFTLEVLITP
jgi:hypothetical protein